MAAGFLEWHQGVSPQHHTCHHISIYLVKTKVRQRPSPLTLLQRPDLIQHLTAPQKYCPRGLGSQALADSTLLLLTTFGDKNIGNSEILNAFHQRNGVNEFWSKTRACFMIWRGKLPNISTPWWMSYSTIKDLFLESQPLSSEPNERSRVIWEARVTVVIKQLIRVKGSEEDACYENTVS